MNTKNSLERIGTNNMAKQKRAYPLGVSLTIIIVAIVLSFVDLTFLNDIIGKILDLGAVESMFVAFMLGLVGIAIMASQGLREAHDHRGVLLSLVHYLLWILLGFTFAIIRLFSASVLQLDSELGDGALLEIAGLSIREVDLVIAPLMLFLYIATGLMAKDGVKNLLANSEFDKWWQNVKDARSLRKSEDYKRRKKAEERIELAQAKAEEARNKRMKEVADHKIQDALNGSYGHALMRYREKETEVKKRYEQIVSNIEYIKHIDKQEADFETKVKPGFSSIVTSSIESVQNEVLLMVHRKNRKSEDISKLRAALDLYVKSRNEKNNRE